MSVALLAPPAGPEGGSSTPATSRRSIFLHPGQLCVSAEPLAAVTILGSCVAVCLYDPVVRLGGTNHFLLPDGAGAPGRVAEEAVPLLVARLAAMGARTNDLVAKVFGGACVLEAFRGRGGDQLGARNVEAARRLLEAAAIRIGAEDVGGDHARRLVFFCDTGEAFVRRV